MSTAKQRKHELALEDTKEEYRLQDYRRSLWIEIINKFIDRGSDVDNAAKMADNVLNEFDSNFDV